ncbi:MAG: formate dehydrogenase [Candidatus Thiodiazotropha sp. (ex Dulcina madagascariensis)]|nr:formate dehydrogenase [Candidatus Thiodiazotropha sp. (ex Epidulcina cf. delphinae)]MCU7936520.1 formate dehydrogenase [Candidatus Thiodiazotropha sp. (ex Dulcina madagascariensis)]
MKKRPEQSANPKRRAFLRGAAGAGVGAAVAVSLPGLASTEETAGDDSKPQKGYRLTPHIAAYYKSTVG